MSFINGSTEGKVCWWQINFNRLLCISQGMFVLYVTTSPAEHTTFSNLQRNGGSEVRQCYSSSWMHTKFIQIKHLSQINQLCDSIQLQTNYCSICPKWLSLNIVLTQSRIPKHSQLFYSCSSPFKQTGDGFPQTISYILFTLSYTLCT